MTGPISIQLKVELTRPVPICNRSEIVARFKARRITSKKLETLVEDGGVSHLVSRAHLVMNRVREFTSIIPLFSSRDFVF